jgi:predicted GIY-YIG superfamily endonuclease
VHYVYVLHSGGRTYTGYTNNLARRLRKHNGALKGGAKSTRDINDWKFLSITSCPDWTAQRALQVEYSFKHPTRQVPARYRSPAGRIDALTKIWKRVPDAMTTQTVPDHVTIIEMKLISLPFLCEVQSSPVFKMYSSYCSSGKICRSMCKYLRRDMPALPLFDRSVFILLLSPLLSSLTIRTILLRS